jgi:hypothetical protein
MERAGLSGAFHKGENGALVARATGTCDAQSASEMGHKRPKKHVSTDGSFRQLRKSDHGDAPGMSNLPCKLRLSPPLMKMLWKAGGNRRCKSLQWAKNLAFAGAILAVPSSWHRQESRCPTRKGIGLVRKRVAPARDISADQIPPPSERMRSPDRFRTGERRRGRR